MEGHFEDTHPFFFYPGWDTAGGGPTIMPPPWIHHRVFLWASPGAERCPWLYKLSAVEMLL